MIEILGYYGEGGGQIINETLKSVNKHLFVNRNENNS